MACNPRALPSLRPGRCRSGLPLVGLLVGLLGVGLFRTTAAADQPAADQTLEQRRQQLQQMSEAEKAELLQKKRRFDQLSREDQGRMRRLASRLALDPSADRLRLIMERYSEWLKTLRPGERAELLNLPPDQRIEKIKEMIKQQESQRFRMLVDGRLKPNDYWTIRKWINQYVETHEQEILGQIPDERFGELKKHYDPERHRPFLSYLVFGYTTLDLPRPSAEAAQQMAMTLSAEARQLLAKAPSDKDRDDLLRWWIRSAATRRSPPPSREELEEFVTKHLDQATREQLESLPRDQMYRRLHFLYANSQSGRPGESGGMRWLKGRGPGRGGFRPPMRREGGPAGDGRPPGPGLRPPGGTGPPGVKGPPNRRAPAVGPRREVVSKPDDAGHGTDAGAGKKR